MKDAATSHEPFELIGGKLCLDFVNTVHNYGSDEPDDNLVNVFDFLSWALQAGAINDRERVRLVLEAQSHPRKAKAALERAKVLRDVLYRIFSAIASNGQPEKADLTSLNIELAEAMTHSLLVPGTDGYIWEWASEGEPLDRLLWPLARSAADLLTSPVELSRVRECSGKTCTWLFVDTSKNRSRRWCEMRACGNRAKSRRHYERSRSPVGVRQRHL